MQVAGAAVVETLSLAGIHMSDIPMMNYEKHLFHEKNIHSVEANTREDGQNLLKEAAEIPVKSHTTTYKLEDANQALQDLKNDQINGTGILVMSDEFICHREEPVEDR